MEPRKHTLAELFEGQLEYVVPSYQRLYVWNRDDQWEPLWDDVQEIADELLHQSKVSGSPQIDPNTVDAHFLGAVVLKISGSTPDLARQLRVIDGQQRLTTLQMLIAASINELENAGLDNQSERLRHLTTNFPRSSKARNQNYKITHNYHGRGHDYEQFPVVMTAALHGDSTAPTEGPLADCYRFYTNMIRTWLNQESSNGALAASALTTTLILKLHLVAIYLDPHEKEHIIFETLNARGEPLTEWDKIKNYLLYKSDQLPDLSQSEFFETYLDQFDDPWWRESVGRGLQRPRTDIFSDYWLESRLRRSVAVRRVFRDFQRHVDSDTGSLESMMQEFVRDAHYFRRFEEPDTTETDRESLFHTRRIDLSIGAIWPLLMYLQRLEVDSFERNRWFEILESYFVRRMIARYQARAYDQVALDLLKAVASAGVMGAGVAHTISRHLLQYKEAASVWPSDIEMREAVLARHLPRYAQRLVLVAVEKNQITDRAGLPNLPSGVQIEHLMPVAWQPEWWPLPASTEPELGVAKREQAIWTLGNLTLLNGRLNAAISNAAWSKKRAAIQKSDNLFLNRRLLEQSPDEWTEEQIYKRGEWICDEVIGIWPRG